VVISGGGFGGFYAARTLERLLPRQSARITLVNDVNFLLYTPFLPEAAAGMLEPRHVVTPLRDVLRHTRLRIGAVTGRDPARRTVTMVDQEGAEHECRYDRLVVAHGSVSRVLPVPGLGDHGIGFKTLADAIHLRNRVLRALEAADAEDDPVARERHLTFVFVGAGYAGVEALAELHDLVRDALRFYPRLRETRQRWVLVDAAPRILPEIPARLGAYAARHLARQGIELRTGTTLASVDGDGCDLSDGTRIAARTLVWTAGVRANPVLADLGLPLDERGRVQVGPSLLVAGRDDVWALGDCAAVPNAATAGRTDPPTCQHALRQARRLAKNLRAVAAGRETRPYRYRMLGQVATLGRHKGIADALGLQLSGFAGWWVTRSYHLIQLPLTTRKLRIVADWTSSLFFRRDIAELGTLGHPPRLE
jgi:NADH dehydrogenase